MSYIIGDVYGGGKIFYIAPDGLTGLVASQTLRTNDCPWAVNADIVTNAVSVSDGKTNTDLILATQGTEFPAAKVCRDYRGGEFTDWYLPSFDELMILRNNYVLLGLATQFYWSSTEEPVYHQSARRILFYDGAYEFCYKTDSDCVCAIRQVVLGLTPVADFSGTPQTTESGTGTPQGAYPLEVHFTDLSTNTPTSWLWTFGDGLTSNEQNPVHTYTTGGIFDVYLDATNSTGTDRETKNGYIYVVVLPPPVAHFPSFYTNTYAPVTIHFTEDSTGNPTSWLWNFGDGNTSTLQSPTHEYTTAGAFTVSLTVTNAGGSDTATHTGEIRLALPPPSGQVTPFVPESNVVNVPILTAFSWGASPTVGVTYDLQVCQGAAITDTFVVNETAINALSRTLTNPLTNNTQYTWRVRATSVSGSSVWSTARSFTTIAMVPPGITFFKAYPDTINIGESSTLRFEVFRASRVTINGFELGATEMVVSPIVDTTYVLVASNAGGETTMSCVVHVTQPTTTPTLVVNVLKSSLRKGETTQIQALYTNNMGVRSDVTSQITWNLSAGISIVDKMLTSKSTGRYNIIGSYAGISAIAVVFVRMQGAMQVSQGVNKQKKYNDVYAQAKAELAAMNKKGRK